MYNMGFLLTFLFTISMLHARTQKGIERLNFFPDADAYLSLNYEHFDLDIETPQTSIQSKGVNNYSNRFSGTYGHRAGRKIFIGVHVGFEAASENGVVYGIPSRRRFKSSGVVEPALLGIYRLRSQKEKKGMIDLHFFASPSLGRREIGEETTTRFYGRDIYCLGLSHGFMEDRWEFQNLIEYRYFSRGNEDNKILRTSFNIESSWRIRYRFSMQYELSPDYEVLASIGLIYRSPEKIRSPDEDTREIRSGTASVLGIGLKRPLSEWSMLEGKYSLQREEYFVRSSNSNLDGTAMSQKFTLGYVLLF